MTPTAGDLRSAELDGAKTTAAPELAHSQATEVRISENVEQQ